MFVHFSLTIFRTFCVWTRPSVTLEVKFNSASVRGVFQAIRDRTLPIEQHGPEDGDTLQNFFCFFPLFSQRVMTSLLRNENTSCRSFSAAEGKTERTRGERVPFGHSLCRNVQHVGNFMSMFGKFSAERCVLSPALPLLLRSALPTSDLT